MDMFYFSVVIVSNQHHKRLGKGTFEPKLKLLVPFLSDQRDSRAPSRPAMCLFPPK